MAYAKQGNTPVDNRCPTPVDSIVFYLNETRHPRPKCLPFDNHEAARFWINHQPKIDNFTESSTPPVEKGAVWKTPYNDRLVERLKIFASFNDAEQICIINQVEAGVPWRGDPITVYMAIVEEEAKMASMVQSGRKEEYRDDVFRQMKRKLRGMIV